MKLEFNLVTLIFTFEPVTVPTTPETIPVALPVNTQWVVSPTAIVLSVQLIETDPVWELTSPLNLL